MDNICRLCSTDKNLIHVYNEPRVRNLNVIRYAIWLSTGIQIKETDIVSRMVCQRCCEVAIKLYKYRTTAISNDKLLKEQYGQPYSSPIINQEEVLYLAAKIASEHIIALNKIGNIPNSLDVNGTISISPKQPLGESSESLGILQSKKFIADNADSSDEIYKHQSSEQRKQYTDILHCEVFSSDVSHVISINSKEVTNGYSEQASRIQSNLTNTVNKKESSTSPINPYTTDTKKEANISSSTGALSDNSTSLNLDNSTSANRIENDKSTLDMLSDTTLNTERLQQDTRKKLSRPSRSSRKRSIDNTYEVIPKKKIRGFKDKKPKSMSNKIDLPSQLPNDKICQKAIFTSSLALVPSEPSAINMISASSPSSLNYEAVPDSPTSSSSISLVLNSITPPPISEYGADEILLDHADREHIMTAEKTLPVFICFVCNKLCDSKKQLSDHEKVHLKCKFCKMRMNSIKALNKHLKQNCFINIVRNLPDLILTKVEFIPELVGKYPEAFEGVLAVQDGACNLNKNEVMVNSESDIQFTEYILQNPFIINNNNNTQEDVDSDQQNKTFEVEVMCLKDESDEEVEWVDVNASGLSPPPSQNNQNPLDNDSETEVIYDLFKKYHSNPADVPKNEIKCIDATSIMIGNFISELKKHKVLVHFRPDSRISATFEEKSLKVQRTIILENWRDKKIIDVRSPYVPYARFKMNTNLISNKQV